MAMYCKNCKQPLSTHRRKGSKILCVGIGVTTEYEPMDTQVDGSHSADPDQVAAPQEELPDIEALLDFIPCMNCGRVRPAHTLLGTTYSCGLNNADTYTPDLDSLRQRAEDVQPDLQLQVTPTMEDTKQDDTTVELVNHPAHYGGEFDPYEVEKVAEAWGLIWDALLWNVLKYIRRKGTKGNEPTLRDLKKAQWYLNRRVALAEGKVYHVTLEEFLAIKEWNQT